MYINFVKCLGKKDRQQPLQHQLPIFPQRISRKDNYL